MIPLDLGFRSIEFRRSTGIDPNFAIGKCSSTLRYLTHTTHINYSQLRVFEIRIEFRPFDFREFTRWLASTTGTIVPPVFHGFFLVVEDAHCPRLFGRVDERGAVNVGDKR